MPRRAVYINGRFLSQPREGVQRAAEQIVVALDALLVDGGIAASDYRLTLLVPGNCVRSLPLERIEVRTVGRFRGHLWEQVELAWYARDGILLSLGNTAPLAKHSQVVMVYDAAVFAAAHGYSPLFLAWYRRLLPALGRRAHTIVTGSEFSRRELCRHAGYLPSRVKVAPLGAEHLERTASDTTVLDRYGLRGRRYVLAVSSLNPNKNFGLVVAALQHLPEQLDVELVIAGGTNPRVFSDSSGANALARAVHVGYVEDSALRALYEHAAAFVFPSLYEGFGFPPLEAMGFGCPVLASDIPVLREVCGVGAHYFDPHDPAALARALQEVLGSEETATTLRTAGYQQAQRFRWRECARQVFHVVATAAAEASTDQG